MKNLKISKELLSEVLGINDIVHVQKEGSCSIFISRANNPAYIINIYEFAFRCKEWARDKYDITVSSSIYKKYAKAWDISNDKSYIADTEIECIIKACECIMKEIKDN